MRKRIHSLWAAPFLAAALVLAAEEEVPAEVLQNLDFFLNYDISMDLDALEPEEGSTAPAPPSKNASAVSVSSPAATSSSTDTRRISP